MQSRPSLLQSDARRSEPCLAANSRNKQSATRANVVCFSFLATCNFRLLASCEPRTALCARIAARLFAANSFPLRKVCQIEKQIENRNKSRFFLRFLVCFAAFAKAAKRRSLYRRKRTAERGSRALRRFCCRPHCGFDSVGAPRRASARHTPNHAHRQQVSARASG